MRASRIAAAATAAAIFFSPSIAIAAAAPPAAVPLASQSPWLTLTMLTPSAMIGLAGTAAQPGDVPPAPPPPPPPESAGLSAPGAIPVLAFLVADVALMIYIGTRNNNHHLTPAPNSPF